MAEANQQTNTDSILGRLVVERGLATPQDVEDCLQLQQELDGDDPSQRSLSDLLVSSGIVTSKQLERIKPSVEAEASTRKMQQIPGYQIEKKLGAGAMAAVYLAKQISLDRMVAIKVLPQEHTNDPEFVERFYAEGRAAAKLNHPNIVAAYDVGQAGEYHYFVMEYVEGHTVFDDLATGKRYNEKRALEIVIQVARALSHAHEKGFIHRDVKPKNIMITKGGVAKLADMGLARPVDDREAAEAEAGKAYGTPYYISPEQIRGEVDVDFRCDIYGLGATFYHMVTGRVPFDGPNPSAVMHKHLKSDLVPPDHINPNLSAGIGEVIEYAMAKDRKERYSSTEDMLHDLEAVAKGEAPLQARKNFDISSLAAMEESATLPAMQGGPAGDAPARADATAAGAEPGDQPELLEQPIFWVAVTGWLVAIIAIVIAVVT